MGAKTCLLIHTDVDAGALLRDRPSLDRDAAARLVARLFPKDRLYPDGEVDLTHTYPADDEVLAACYPGLSIMVARDFGLDRPSQLPRRFIQSAGASDVMVHAMHSVVDWFGFAVWKQGQLCRSLSLSPDSGILENSGEPLSVEMPYWNGGHPAFDDGEDEGEGYPFRFHPLELGEAVLHAFLGFHLEGDTIEDVVDPESVLLLRYRRQHRPWWKFWP